MAPGFSDSAPNHRRALRRSNGYVPISDYGFLSDCRSSALVASDGSVDWLCWPRFDSPSVFGAVLDAERGGAWRLRPTATFTTEREYLPGTNVLATTFLTASGVVRVTDWLHIGARQSLCRLVLCLEGEMELDLDCDPRPDYGRRGSYFEERMGYLVSEMPGGGRLVLDGQQAARERTVLRSGDTRELTLSFHRPGPTDLVASLRRTVSFWEHWSRGLKLPALGREHAQRSALVLKGLQYRPTGAILAAATTSLPEAIGGGRNYDYRFSWLRDATFTLYALARCGKRDEAGSWFDWLQSIALSANSAQLQIMYGIDGETELGEHELSHLDGYRGSRPVRIGNAAAGQRQLDVYGAVLDAIWLQRRSSDRPLNRHRWLLVEGLAERACVEWREPDEGIWEVRGEPQHFVYSKVMCWVALDRALSLAAVEPQLAAGAPLERWRAERDAIRAEVMARGFDDGLGTFTQAYGSRSLDASNLLLAQVGFIPTSDPRWVGTVRVIQRDLSRGGLVDRYRTDQTDDGFEGEEGTFAICSLWLCLALAGIGEVDEARQLFDRVTGCANELGLLSEELTPDGEQLGNFPQAFTHIAVIACAFALDRAARRRRLPSAAV